MTHEEVEVLQIFNELLKAATVDGAKKRILGLKPLWKIDEHKAAMLRHLKRWRRGEKTDKDSGAHPLVHCAWRALAIAYQEGHFAR